MSQSDTANIDRPYHPHTLTIHWWNHYKAEVDGNFQALSHLAEEMKFRGGVRAMKITAPSGEIVESWHYDQLKAARLTTPDVQVFAIDRETGRWISEGTLTPRQRDVIASSMLPGTTPKQVNEWYATLFTD